MKNTRIHYRRRAFTLVEVLVATTLTLGLLTIIGMALQSTNDLVNITVANQDVGTYASGLANQMRNDFKRLRNDTYLVIKNETSPATVSGGIPHNLDQIMFFANGPYTSQQYINAGAGNLGSVRSTTASLARIWYGHLSGNTDFTFLAAGKAFQPQYASDGTANGTPIEETKWLLGRHALLISNKTFTEVGLVGGKYAPTSLWQHLDSSNVTNHRGLAFGEWDVLVDNAALGFPFNGNAFSSIFLQASVADGSLPAGTPPGFDAAIPVTYPASKVLSAINYDWSPVPAWGGGSTVSQRNDAMRDACFRVYGTRFVQDAAVTDLRIAAQLASNVAAPFCSEFRVEFAGDYTGTTPGIPDGTIDYETTASHMGIPVTTQAPTGDIYWYGSVNPAAHPTRAAYRRYVLPLATYGSKATPGPLNYFAYDDGDTPTPPATPEHQPYCAVFGPDKSVTPWPKLIRVTFVLHDEAGRLHARYLTSVATGSPLPTSQDGRTYQFVFEVP